MGIANEAGEPPFNMLDQQQQDRIAAEALIHYKEALAQHRSDFADAQLDYASRLKMLRDSQSQRLAVAITKLQTATPPELPDPGAHEYGTKISLRAVR